jgi:sirohydrochlorin cobaltochelatase
MGSTPAVILFAHGSRDPLWRLPLEAVAQRLAQRGALVRCAYLELDTPELPACVAELAAAGAQDIRIVPMFLGAGRHVRQDLPALVGRLRQEHPGIGFDLRQPVGEDGRVLDLLAEIALE